MKNFTILENEENQVMMVKSDDIYGVAYLNHSIDHSYILENGELTATEDMYPCTMFDEDTRIVVKVEDIKNDRELSHNLASYPRLTIKDEWDDEDIELIDVTDCYNDEYGKAVDIEHGINTDTIYFDVQDDDTSWGWHSVEEVEADYEIEHYQDYPNQELTRIYTCSNGKKIRETSPFFADQSIESYEYVD